MTYVRMADAAYAANIPPGYDIAGGYYGGPQAFHVWPASDWARFPGDRLPIWVGAGSAGEPPGSVGGTEGRQAVAALRALKVPAGSITVLDMETHAAPGYVTRFGTTLEAAGYRIWVYGSAAFVGNNPPLHGYWVADYTNDMREIDRVLQEAHVRAVQYQPGPGFDGSLVKQWTEGEMWRG